MHQKPVVNSEGRSNEILDASRKWRQALHDFGIALILRQHADLSLAEKNPWVVPTNVNNEVAWSSWIEEDEIAFFIS